MEAQPISEEIKEEYPTFNVVVMGPPAGIAEEDCYSLETLQGYVSEGAFDGAPLFKSYWKPTEAELAILNSGGTLELGIIGMFPPIYVGVHDG